MSKQQSVTKTIHALKSPYSDPEWPILTAAAEDPILDALLLLLSPIGEYRDNHVSPSKGKRRKKNKRKDHVQECAGDASEATAEQPAIQEYLTVGFNTTVRELEQLAQKAPSTEPTNQEQSPERHGLFTVFVCLHGLPSVLTAPLPLLATTATISAGGNPDVRLVPISQKGASKIAGALRQPRVNFLGVKATAPNAKELCDLVRGSVSPVMVPWIQEARATAYEPPKIHTENVVVKVKSDNDKRKRKAEKLS